MTQTTTIPLEKVRDMLSMSRYRKPYKELCEIRQRVIEELIKAR